MISNDRQRLEQGGAIDRTRPLSFIFDGRSYRGYAGDTLASALLANGVRVVGRSFKLHRPRGLIGSWCEEPNAIVQVGRGAMRSPNLKATQIELSEGLYARSVNCWPSARHDIFAPLQWLWRFTPAGFYYKTFMWPGWSWFEPLIRRAAGLGTAPELPDPDRYDERYEHCDVLVVGGGATGLSAALAAGRAGARVVLVDDRPRLGGALQWETVTIQGIVARNWIPECEAALGRLNVRILRRTTAFGCYDHNLVALNQRLEGGDRHAHGGRLWHVRAKRIVLATGAIERPLVFENNDLPGIMLTSAAMCYAVQFAVRPGRRAVLVTSCDSAYEAAKALQERGVAIVSILDLRTQPTEAAQEAAASGLTVMNGYGPARAIGRGRVRALEARPLSPDGSGWLSSERRRLNCDLVCVSGGWTPTVHLFSQTGGRLHYDAGKAALLPDQNSDDPDSRTSPHAFRCAGAAAGSFTVEECLSDGAAAGYEATQAATGDEPTAGPTVMSQRPSAETYLSWNLPPDRRRQAWVDMQNDVTREDLELAVRENFSSVEHMKRYTTAGMAVDQGKTSNMNALGLLAALTSRDIGTVGTTTFRPPYDPVALGTLAGRRVGAFYQPIRRTPLHGWHAAHGAELQDFGGWLRPAWYRRGGLSQHDCVIGEKRTARTGVSLFDGAPLGKLEVRGPDALIFLNRMYYTDMRTLKVGRARYGIMLNEHGTIIDDGVCMRLADEHFLITTTSSGASRIGAQFEEWLQCEWPQLRVLVCNVTSQWGNIAVAGPQARELLGRLETDIDLRPEAFPHLSIRTGVLEGLCVRIARVGFTGELSFEISVAANLTQPLWEVLLERGAALRVAAIGVDALQELRTEKGYLHVGTDTDGRTIPADIGLGHVLATKSEDFVGRRSLERSVAKDPDRLQLVGIAAEDLYCVLPVGAHVLAGEKPEAGSDGYVTSSCASEAAGRGIALGLVRAGGDRIGESVQLYAHGEIYRARISSPAWYDPQGKRLHA